ncbi:MAG: hypothetical protein ACAF41_11860 [Leptolyngbya sp. BL-A-14]
MITSHYNETYITDHVQRFNQATAQGKHALAVDSLWRISSNADLHSIEQLNEFTRNGMPENIQTDIIAWCRLQGFDI